MYKAARTNDSALVNELLKQGAEMEWRNPNGYGTTPLGVACVEGSYEAAEALYAHGAEVDARNDDQNTPLMHAARLGRTKICEMLLALGADPSLKGYGNKTALDKAREKKHSECVALLQPVTPEPEPEPAALTPAQRQRQQAAAKQQERERDAEAAGTKVSLPA
eukprot:COSAG06_NODE_2245_length_7263_cov_19.964964_12_plen_164_part_00